MRSKLVKILFATVAAFVALCTQAATETVNGIEWKYMVTEEGTAVIGSGEWYAAVDESTSGVVIVPSTLGGCPVVEIGDYAFYDCSSLTMIIIPEGISSIGEYAFYNCGSLTDLIIPDSVTSIGWGAFYYCGLITNVVIPSNITHIPGYMFSGCYSLESVMIPDSITSIGEGAFYECSSLTNAIIPRRVDTIDVDVFSGCLSLENIVVDSGNAYYKSVDGLLLSRDGSEIIACPGGKTDVIIPDNVLNIGEDAFSWCELLANVIIADSVMNIDEYAFVGCSSLTNITIPYSVVNIGVGAFAWCESLEEVLFERDRYEINVDFKSAFKGTPWLTSGDAFPPSTNDNFADAKILSGKAGCVRGSNVSATSETIEEGLGLGAATVWWKWIAPFSANTQFHTIGSDIDTQLGIFVLKDGLLTKVVFDDDDRIVNFDANAGTTYYIGISGYDDSQGFITLSWQQLIPPENDNFDSAITLSGKVGSVGGSNINATSEAIDDSLGFGLATVWWKWTAPSSSLMQFDTFGSEFDTMLGIYILEDGTFTEVAFNDEDEDGESEYGESRVKFNVNAGTTYYIGVSGYSDEQGYILLNWDSVPEFECSVSEGGVTIIEYRGIGNAVEIPSTVEGQPVVSIGAEAFYECASLMSVTIPSSVTNIGDYAFYNCENLTNVVWEGDVSSIEFGDDVFYGTQYEIIIPEQFELLIDEENVLIGFTGTCPANVVIPDGVVAIAGGAFAGWNNDIGNLESVTIPSSVTKIGNLAFNSCYNLSEVIFEGEMSSVDFGYAVFYGTPYNENSPFTLLINKDNVLDGFIGPCPVNLVIPDGVVAIAESAFDGWNNDTENLETVRIPTSVTSIGNYAFYLCANLTYAKVPEALKSKVEEGNVFVGCFSDLQIEYYGAASLVEPVISPMNGTEFYGDSCTVTISCATEGASIYYIVCDTNNVTNPRPSDRNLYTGPFTVSATKMVRAFSMLDSKTSDVVSATFIKRELALPIAVDATNLVFTTGGDAQWTLVSDISAKIGDSFAQSGKLIWSEEDWEPSETWMETTVTGEGVFSFWWKTDCEDDPWGATWDRLMVFTNGVEAARIDGKTEWEQLTFSFNDISSHTIRWVFCKDDWDDEKLTDLAWVDGVVWTPTSDPMPELNATATAEQVAAALEGSADTKLVENIKAAAEYAAFREWALGLAGVTPDAVKASPNAWLSYALDMEALIAAAPKVGDIVIDTFESAATEGAFEFTVKIDGITVGENALEVNLKKVFDIEGAEKLVSGGAGFSFDNVEVNAAAPENGNVKFMVTPKGGALGTTRPTSFFFRVKMK